jgi:hypothetical protein
MSLINCKACGWQISSEAESCPQCGHPNRKTTAPPGPRCYACQATATTRCQSCEKVSCVQHLRSIFVRRGNGGAYELRCDSCYSSAQAYHAFLWIVVLIGLVIFAVIVFGVALPEINKAERDREKFKNDSDMRRQQMEQEFEESRKKRGFPR